MGIITWVYPLLTIMMQHCCMPIPSDLSPGLVFQESAVINRMDRCATMHGCRVGLSGPVWAVKHPVVGWLSSGLVVIWHCNQLETSNQRSSWWLVKGRGSCALFKGASPPHKVIKVLEVLGNMGWTSGERECHQGNPSSTQVIFHCWSWLFVV